jgi:Tfp pilus assembly major pilin PilA
MVLIAILGIVLAVAIPAYRDYLVRSKVAAGLLPASAAQALVEKNFSNNARPPLNSGWTSPAATEELSSIVIDNATGVVKVTFTEKAGETVVTLTPKLERGRQIEWRCAGEPSRYIPAACRDLR